MMSLQNFNIPLLLLALTLQPAQSAHQLQPMTIKGEGISGTCPSQEKRDAVIQNITASIQNLVSVQNATADNDVNNNCGPGEWHRVASLNMSDPCPSAWREYNTSGVRACGRPVTSSGSCPATFFATGRQYSRVCGRAIGYQIGSPDAFGFNAQGHTIDSYYVYGVSITHGTPRNHIWTYAAGTTEGGGTYTSGSNCPCVDPPSRQVLPPSFVGDNYYCESGNAGNSYISGHLYNSDPLWDGQQCEGECCSNGKSPPWFSVELPNPTADDIEVRICSAEGTIDDVPVEQLELYIQ